MRTRPTVVLLLLAAVLVALPAASARATTIIVGCSGTPTTDGANLLSAYNGASGSATAPVVVQPSACLYDLGTSTLTMQSFVDLIGIGRNTTIITSQVDRTSSPNSGTITVPSGVDAEIANLTIRNEDTTACYAVRNASSDFVIQDSNLEATCGEDAVALYTVASVRGIGLVLLADASAEEADPVRAVALEDVGGDSVVSNTLMTSGGATANQVFGVILDGSDATLDDVSISAGGDVSATGFSISGGSTPAISNSKAFVTGGNSLGAGVDVSGSSNVVLVSDTRLVIGAGSGGAAYGVRNQSSSSSIQLIDLNASAGSGSTQVGVQVSNGLVNVDRSSASGGTNSLVVSSGATARVGVSKLTGSRSISGTATCVGAYDGGYTAIGTSC